MSFPWRQWSRTTLWNSRDGGWSPDTHPDANLIGAYLEGGLPRRTRRRLLDHLGDCPPCRTLAVCANTARHDSLFERPLRPVFVIQWTRPFAAAVSVAAAVALVWVVRPAWFTIHVTSPAAPTTAAATPLVMQRTDARATRITANRLSPSPKEGFEHAFATAGGPVVVQTVAVSMSSTGSALAAASADASPVAESAGDWPGEIIATDDTVPPYAADVPSSSRHFTPVMTGFQEQSALSGTASAQVAMVRDAWLPQPWMPATQQVAYVPAASAAFVGAVDIAEGYAPPPIAPPPSNEVRPSLLSREAHNLAIASLAAPGDDAPAKPATSDKIESHRALAGRIANSLGWTVTRSGQLLRSVGAGAWSLVPLGPDVQVNALTAAGDSVWAGGRIGELFVTKDRGLHWRHVGLPGDDPQHASDTIASIDFADASHGTILSDDGQIWTTVDGGKHWSPTAKSPGQL